MQPHGAGAPDNRPARSARLWDRVGSGSGSAWAERLTGPIHAQLAEVLELAPGQRVLDIGCGDGAYFPTIHAAVGPSGDIHGIDASDNMIARARARIAEHSWDNVTAEHADFTRAELDLATYDAALAVFAFSAMSDVPTAVSIAHHALRPGGRLFVVDLRLVPHGRTAPLIHLARLTYRALAGWSGVDVLNTICATFPVVGVVRGDRHTWPPVAVVKAKKEQRKIKR